jgi:SAM-dependent methyltransferase
MWTVNRTSLDDVAIVGDRRGGLDYAPTTAWTFARALRVFGVPAEGRFVDFGCGKGRALVLALDYGFDHVIGIEYGAELHRYAERVLARYGRRTGSRRADVLLADAGRYRVSPLDRVFYLFNPFDAEVLAEVLSNLETSLVADPRDAWLIYANPVHGCLIDRSPVWSIVGERRFAGGRHYACYRTTVQARPTR